MAGVYQIPLVISGTTYYVGNNNIYTGDMATGPDGKIWVTGGTSTTPFSYNTIFQIDPATGLFNYYVPSGFNNLQGIVSDGTNLWFSGLNSSNVFTWAKMNTSGTVLATYPNSSYGPSNGTYSFDGTYIWWNNGGSELMWFNTTTHVYGYTNFTGLSNLSSAISDGTNVYLGFNVNIHAVYIQPISWIITHTGNQSGFAPTVTVIAWPLNVYTFDFYYDGTTVWCNNSSQIDAINASTLTSTTYSSYGTTEAFAYGIIADGTSVWVPEFPNSPPSYSPVGTRQLSQPPTSTISTTNELNWNAKTLDPLGYVWMNNLGTPVGGVLTNRFIASGNPIVMII